MSLTLKGSDSAAVRLTVLHKCEGLTDAQIARELHVSEETVRTRLQQARHWFREEGYGNVSNVILLRKAAREARWIDELPLI